MMHPDWKSICQQFIEATSYKVGDLEKGWASKYDFSTAPPKYLRYEDALIHIPLGVPDFPESINIWEILKTRRTMRNFTEVPLSLNELNILLWGTQGITATHDGYELRTTPSAGGLSPIETYLMVNNVEGLEQGLYHLDVERWTLEGLKLEDVSEVAYLLTENQEMTRHCAVNFIWTAVLDRTEDKYKERAYRYIFWDSGIVSQNLQIVGTGLGLGVATIGHLMDENMNDYLGINGRNHMSMLMASVGHVSELGWEYNRRYKK